MSIEYLMSTGKFLKGNISRKETQQQVIFLSHQALLPKDNIIVPSFRLSISPFALFALKTFSLFRLF
jgi:hypothetical protein